MIEGLESDTLFIFPFDRPSKAPSEALEEITHGLNGLADTTLLFLASLQAIQWQIQEQATSETSECSILTTI